ncbi:flagellar protofilament ribbon protein-like protein [Angomonas deanei]|uniref:RIB43A, putative n=1 Tax=Angomonas deanei TaxID=59799 RepID=A0A7G2CTL0_9TRYP|nr:flagellar protofilament ribbon protein-like protein [Angomonas deanei]CAD2222587.1 RIB43A, putative [Angomonas deanei]|eukprot:EPY25794.1 flagellar protofilament ribbon protein-like protein [Angomonas deanei]
MEREAERMFDERNEEVNYRTYMIEKNMNEQRRLIERNTATFNKALAEQQRREAIRAKEEETRLGLEEIAYQTNSDFLNEREGVVSGLGETVKSERFKGLSEEQRARIREEQNEQLQQLRRRRLMEVEENKQWSQQENMQVRMAQALDRQQERERHAEMLALAEHNRMQAEAAKTRTQKLNELYTNEVDEDYYKYWNRME